MNKKQVEKKVNSGFTNATPDVYDSVKSDCHGCYGQATVTARPAPRRIMPWRIATFALAFILVAVAIVGSIGLHGEYASAATVSLDVNPSVEIKINGKQRVISAEGLNEEGKDIIGKMELKGCQLEVAVNAIIGSMLRKGYLSDLANSVLVSVDSSKDLYNQLVNTVSTEISLTMQDKNIEASVVSQWIKTDDEIAALAKKYDISVGKAQLIHKIAAASDLYTEEQLVALSVNDLSIILGNVSLPADGDITQSGTASDKTYLGADEALKVALAKLGMEGLTSESGGLMILENKLDYEDGTMVYEVEFIYGDKQYEVTIGAVSGLVLSFDTELSTYDFDPTKDKIFDSDATDDKVVEEVLKLAKIDAAYEDLQDVFCEKSRYYRITVYSVSFVYDNVYFECEIDCYGNVLYSLEERLDRSESDGYITRDQVESEFIAKNEQNFTALDKLERFRVTSTIDESTNQLVYNITFVSDKMLYTYTLNAVSGALVYVGAEDYTDIVDDAMHDQFGDKFDGGWMDWDEIWHEDFWQDDFGHGGHGGNHFGGQPIAPPQFEALTEEEVKEIIAWMFDLALESATEWKCELEEGRNGMTVYEVEFTLEGVNYELKINAVTGAVMRVDYEYAH